MNSQSISTVEEIAADILHKSADVDRYVAAIAGPPAAGKSTLAKQLAEILGRQTSVVVVPMDGFHFDNAILSQRDLRHRKGAPQTFDVGGFSALLTRLQAQQRSPQTEVSPQSSIRSARSKKQPTVQSTEQTTRQSLKKDNPAAQDVAIPEFDRDLDLSRACARIVSPSDRILLVEGNYLFLQQAPWDTLFDYFDYRIFLRPSIDVIERRLVERWIRHDHSEAEAIARAYENDLPNAKIVLEQSRTEPDTLQVRGSL